MKTGYFIWKGNYRGPLPNIPLYKGPFGICNLISRRLNLYDKGKLLFVNYDFSIYTAKLFNIQSFMFLQSHEMDEKHMSLQPVNIQKYVDR